jgi:transcriptional antiterminator RfaH
MEMCLPLFPGYAFVSIKLQWSKARYAPGIVGLIMNGAGPAHVPDRVVAEIRSREVGGLVELSKAHAFRRGDHVRIQRGPFAGRLAIIADMKPHQRVEVLLGLLGSEQRATLAATDVQVL